jgi:hypothetical protein
MKGGTYMEEREAKLQRLRDRLRAIDDDQIEALYRNCLIFETKKDESYTLEDFNSMKKDFEIVTNEKVGFLIMERYILSEIARRWRKQRKLLKGFKELFVQI